MGRATGDEVTDRAEPVDVDIEVFGSHIRETSERAQGIQTYPSPSILLRMRARPALIALVLVAGCIRYRPAPLSGSDPLRAATDFRSRRLDDPGLLAYVGRVLGPDTSAGWTEDRIALAALYFRADLAVARAAVDEATAGVMTAGAWPPFAAEGSLSRTARPLENTESRWSESITATATIELGGKRGARTAGARAEALAARLGLDATAWQLADDARAAELDAIAAERDAADAGVELTEVRALTELQHDRYAEGQLALSELARSETDARAAAVAVVEADREQAGARAALARALGVAFERVETLPLRATAASSCAVFDSLAGQGGETAARESLAVHALRDRPDIGVALAEYTAADASVRLEVARQYPDLTLGPGLLWDQGVPGWIVNIALPSILGGRNRGPIAAAEARRAEQGARVQVLQDSVLSAVESAIAGCRGLQRLVATTDSLVMATRRSASLADSAYQRGETGRTEVAIAQVAEVRSVRAYHAAVARYIAAGATLDRAAGRWIALTPRGPWPGPADAHPSS
jgi:outer membrane protein, heavy metal efflux system